MSETVNDRLGRWLSAALDDPAVCEEMKVDIRAWFEQENDRMTTALVTVLSKSQERAILEAEQQAYQRRVLGDGSVVIRLQDDLEGRN